MQEFRFEWDNFGKSFVRKKTKLKIRSFEECRESHAVKELSIKHSVHKLNPEKLFFLMLRI